MSLSETYKGSEFKRRFIMTNAVTKHPAEDATFADYLTSLQNVTEFVAMDAHYDWEQTGKEDDHLWNDVVRCRLLYRALKLSDDGMFDENGELKQ